MTTATLAYRDFKITGGYQWDHHSFDAAVIDFWMSRGALADRQSAERRLRDLILVVQNRDDDIIGISTSYLEFRPRLNHHAMMYRTFVDQPFRGSRLMIRMIDRTYDILNAASIGGAPIGLIAETENPKLMKSGVQKQMSRLGFELLGMNQQQQHVWLRMFDHLS
ncbi:MAG: hypothetical protein AAF402_00725 [Pseudomonadota bacterium]